MIFIIVRYFPEFKKKKVLVMGLGFHGGGIGAAKFFVRQGAKVTVTDLKSKRMLAAPVKALKGYQVRYVLGKHRDEDFKNTDFIFKSPDVPQYSSYLAVARKYGVPILDVASLFLAHCPAQVIGVTGTKGKSSTATFLYELLKATYRRVWLLGTPGTSILETLPRVSKEDLVILELSSFQLEDLHPAKISPHVSIITSLFPDHLSRHKTFKAYTRAKSAIFRYQDARGVLVIPEKSRWAKLFRSYAIGKVVVAKPGTYARVFRVAKDLTLFDKQNFALAFEAAKRLGATRRDFARALRSYARLPGRREVVRRVSGIAFINDTTATNPGAAIASIRYYRALGPLVLIAGGTDKGLEFREFTRALYRYPKYAVLLPGTATEKIKNFLSPKTIRRIHEARSMKEAVRVAYQHARQGDTVLLSPGAASFGLFKHEFDRGDRFVAAVKRLRQKK